MIVEATLPLLLEYGEAVTTRQIADAAGIAEGTIFRAFTDKDEVIAAVLEKALDTTALEEALSRIKLDRPFEKCLDEAVAAIQRRVVDIWQLMSAVGPRFHPQKKSEPTPISPALTRLFEAHKDRLGVKPAEAAKFLRALTMSVTHPMLNDNPMSSRDVVKLFLYGVHARPDGRKPGAC